MIWKTKEHREGGELNREARINLDYTPGQMPFPRAMHDFTILVREGEEGEGREEPVGRPFTFTRSIRPTPLRTIYSHGQRRRRDIKKKGQCKMYRYYPLSMWHLQVYTRVGSETESLSLRLTRNRLLTAFATLSMLVWILIMRSRVYLTLDFSLYFSLLSFSRARIRSKLNWNWKSTRSIIFEYFSVQVYLLRL